MIGNGFVEPFDSGVRNSVNDETSLWRQVHPKWVQEGEITSQTFTPTHKDKGKLSVYDGDQINAEDAWTHYVERLGWDSAGVVSVSVGDCIRESLDVAVDPTLFPEHVLIDFNAHTSKNKRKTIGKKLTSIARERGWVYVP